jgi:hypothetical protein
LKKSIKTIKLKNLYFSSNGFGSFIEAKINKIIEFKKYRIYFHSKNNYAIIDTHDFIIAFPDSMKRAKTKIFNNEFNDEFLYFMKDKFNKEVENPKSSTHEVPDIIRVDNIKSGYNAAKAIKIKNKRKKEEKEFDNKDFIDIVTTEPIAEMFDLSDSLDIMEEIDE